VRSGRALLLAEQPQFKPHLWFVLTDRDGVPPRVVAVMLRTATRFTDTTLVLRPGDHPFVRHESSVHYSTARWFSVSSILAAVSRGRCHLLPDASDDLLRKVRAGLLASPFTVNAVRDYCRLRFG
jgi:hypothetical protein